MGWIPAFRSCAKTGNRTPRHVDKAAGGAARCSSRGDAGPGPCLPDQTASADETAAQVDVSSFHSGGTDLTRHVTCLCLSFPFFLCPLFLALLPIDLFACSGTSVGCHAQKASVNIYCVTVLTKWTHGTCNVHSGSEGKQSQPSHFASLMWL